MPFGPMKRVVRPLAMVFANSSSVMCPVGKTSSFPQQRWEVSSNPASVVMFKAFQGEVLNTCTAFSSKALRAFSQSPSDSYWNVVPEGEHDDCGEEEDSQNTHHERPFSVILFLFFQVVSDRRLVHIFMVDEGYDTLRVGFTLLQPTVSSDPALVSNLCSV